MFQSWFATQLLGSSDCCKGLHLLFHRCGSTLLSQMMNRVPNTRVLCSPWASLHLQELAAKDQISMVIFKQFNKFKH